MINYKYINKSTDIKQNLKAISELGKQNWEYKNELDGILIFCKKVVSKQDREKKQETKSPEFIEFSQKYSIIKNSGLSDEKLISKYNKLTYKHQEIMNGLDKYIKKIKAENIAKNFILMASTFISQERWKDDFTVMENRVGFSQKWMLPYLQEVDEEKAQSILKQVREREKRQTESARNESLKILLTLTNYEKEELIIRVSELETKLKELKLEINNILSISTKLIKGYSENNYGYLSIHRTADSNIETFEELYFEIGKLVEFRNNILSNIDYERRTKEEIKELEYLRNKFNKELGQ